jgi:phospho-N-acetylmuramoyl-pentapeptide-transferase
MGLTAVYPFLTALVLVLIAGGPTIAYLRSKKSVQPISPDAPEKHRLKHGTPTMGGLLILTAVTIATVVFAVLMPGSFSGPGNHPLWSILAVVGVFLGGGVIGVLDDLGKARKKENKAGLSERAKLVMQLTVGILFGAFLYVTRIPDYTTILKIGPLVWDMGWLYFPFAVLYMTVFANAVNFTDGLDGLLSGVTVIVAGALGLLLPTSGVALFYFAVAGACAGFLWYNVFPARVFMGDTGSLAIGMGLSAAALVAKQEALLVLIGIIYVAEIVSMMVQRYVFKYRRITKGIEYAKANRVFRRAPLHHHFEELGMYETQVVGRFVLVTLIAALVFSSIGFAFMWTGQSASTLPGVTR